jgi:hypothetical protein
VLDKLKSLDTAATPDLAAATTPDLTKADGARA